MGTAFGIKQLIRTYLLLLNQKETYMKLTRNKYKIADFIVVVLAWVIALALVYNTFLKFKRLLH
jgi:uncharacterized membrane protein YukC